MNPLIGTILSGSLSEGLTMRLQPHILLTSIKTGKFVAIRYQDYTFFAIIVDIRLQVNNPDILLFPPAHDNQLLTEILQQRSMYVTVHLRPMISFSSLDNPSPVKTIPPHLSPVFEATDSDVARIFGKETDPSNNYFNIGSPIDMNTPVCIDLEKLTERSSGIFGKTGTGKTFLTRLLLAGVIKKEKAVTLIFDMHSEYGLQSRREGGHNNFVKGLKILFPNSVAIFSLDPQSTRKRGGSPDVTLTISYQDINIEDILSLQEELNLHPTAIEAAYLIAAIHKKDWLYVLLQQGENLKNFALSVGAHPESITALYRKLKRIERLSFINKEPYQSASLIDRMIEYIDNNTNIIIEFGNFTSTFVYLLVANIITRRIHKRYIQKTEQFLGSHKKEDQPKKLLITIEEAHKFLNSSAARQTIFGTIAREMRKYYVSLLIVDQRPSAIDAEIMSQIGTKFVAQLNDENDMQAVLNGTAQNQTLRVILSTLDSKKQALLFGHALPIPIVIESRTYDEQFYRAMHHTPHTSPSNTTSPLNILETIFMGS